MDDIVEGVRRVMQAAPEKKTGEDGLPVPPYAVYNIGNSHPENLLEFVDILQQELTAAGVLPEDYDFESHKKLVPMQPGGCARDLCRHGAPWRRISAFDRIRLCGRACGSLPGGTGSFIWKTEVQL